MAEAITIETITASDGRFPDVREAWEQCLTRCPPTQQLFTFEWYRTWVENCARTAPWTGYICVLIARRADGEAVALLPLVGRRQQRLSMLSLAGLYQPVRSFPCVPADAPAACRAFLQTLAARPERWDLLRLGPIDDATPERVAMLEALNAAGFATASIPLGRTIVNSLETSMEAYASAPAVKKMRYYERRFLRDGDANIRHFENPVRPILKSLLEDLQYVEQRSWLAEQGGDLRFATEADRRFWETVTETSLSPRQQLDVWVAYKGHEPVAFRLVLTAGDMSYLIANQYDQRMAKHSLGWVLFHHNLEVAISRGTRMIDSAPGDLHYKSRLGGEEAQMRVDLLAFRRSPKGHLLACAARSLHAARDILGRHDWTRPLANRLPRI